MQSVLQHSRVEFSLPVLAPAGRDLNPEAFKAELLMLLPRLLCGHKIVAFLCLSQGKVVHWP